MGVNVYLLDKRPAELLIGATSHEIGIVRRYHKVTELNPERAAALDEAAGLPPPRAVLVIDETEIGGRRCHRVLGWDNDFAGTLTDYNWNYLPTLGYAVHEGHGLYRLHKPVGDNLQAVDETLAETLGLVDHKGRLVHHGQPVVTECPAVASCIPGWARARVVLSDGNAANLMTAVDADLPPPGWFVGKRPAECERYKP